MNELASGAAPDAENPWPGLDAFSEAASRFFNGRETEEAELFLRVKREEPTVLFGQSGLGKTSLLQAGLFPLLRHEDYLPVYVRLDHSPGSPPLIEQIWTTLDRACAENGVEAPERDGAESLWEYLHLANSTFWSARNKPLTPVIVLDQFEELFTVGRGKRNSESYDAFLSSFGDLLANRIPKTLLELLNQQPKAAGRFALRRRDYRFVLSLREDFLPDLESLQEEMRVPLQNRMRLLHMTGEQARKAILVTGGKLVDEEIATAIVDAVAGGSANQTSDKLEIEPTLLSVFARELNEKRKRLGRPTITRDLLVGSEREILRTFYDTALRGVNPGMRRFIEEGLVTADGRRNSQPVSDAIATKERTGVSEEAINALVERRVLRREEKFGVMRVELTHDVLTRFAVEDRKSRRVQEQKLKDRAQIQKLLAGVAALAVAVVAAIAVTVWSLRQKQHAQAAENKAVIAERAAVASQATIDTVADYIASAFESGRDTVKQNLPAARDFYRRTCEYRRARLSPAEADTLTVCQTVRNLGWLIENVLPQGGAPRQMPALAGDYILCQVDTFPPSRILPGAARMRIDRVGDSIRVSGGPPDRWTSTGTMKASTGVGFYAWRFENAPRPYGRTAILIDSAGTLYGHVLPLTRNSPISKWWFVARKSDPSSVTCKLP